MRATPLALPFAAALLIAAPSGASAVTIGQVTPAPTLFCSALQDRVQPTVTSGDSYVVPSTGGVTSWVVTSWSSNAGAGTGDMTMKIYRPVAGTANTYSVVGHDGPRNLPSNQLMTFPTNILVKPGDVLGLNVLSGNPYCATSAPGDSYPRAPVGTDLADGQSAAFTDTRLDHRLNISAVINPINTFTLGTVKRNKKKGTATLTVNVPNPGGLTLFGKGLKRTSATATAAGEVKLKIKAKGKKIAKLNATGKVKVTPKVTYTPTGGDPSTQSRKLKLKKTL